MADILAQVTSEHSLSSGERPPARNAEKPGVFKAIQKTYHDARKRMRDALTLPDTKFDLTEFDGKMDALEARQRELDAISQAQLDHLDAVKTGANAKDLTNTDSIDKAEIREQIDEAEKVKKLRLQLGLPETSPLLATPESIAEKKRVVDEYLNEKLQKELNQQDPIMQRTKGFIDRSKESVEAAKNGDRRPLSKGDKIKRAGAIKVFEARGIANAQEIIDFTQAYQLDVKSLNALSTHLKDITFEELQTGRDRLYALGYRYSAFDLESQEFVHTLKQLATVDAETMQKVCDQLNPYSFLDKSSYSITTPDGKPTAELSTLLEIATNGGLTPDQKQILDNAQRLTLLDTRSTIIQRENGDAAYAGAYEKTITEVLTHSFPNQVMQDLLTLCEENAAHILLLPEEKRADYRHVEPETSIFDMINTLENRSVVPLHLAASLTRQGIDSRGALHTPQIPAETEKTRNSLYKMQELMLDPGKREWSLLISELTKTEGIFPDRVELFEEFYQQRETISQLAIITHALPEDMQDLFHSAVLVDQYRQKLQPITPEKTNFLISKITEIANKYPPPDGITPTDWKYLQVLTQFTTHKQTGWRYEQQFDFDTLPLAAYIAENKTDIDILYKDNLNMTSEMAQRVFNSAVLQKNEPTMKWVINRGYRDVDPLLILPHMNLLDVENRAAFIDRIPDSALTNNLSLDADTKTLIQIVKNAPTFLLKNIYASYEGDINNLYQNGAPTEEMFKLLVAQWDTGSIYELSTDIDGNPNLSDKTKAFIQIVASAPTDSLKKIIAENRADIDSLYKDGQPTEKLFDMLLAKADIPTLDVLVGKNTLLDIGIDGNPNLSEKTKMYLNTINNMQTYSLKNLLIQNRDNFDEYFQDGQPTRALVTKVIETRDFYNLPSILTDDVLEQLEGNTGEVLRYWKELSPYYQSIMTSKIPNFPYIEEANFERYKRTVELAVLVEQSPSKEIQRLKQELVDQLIESDNPEHLFAQVEDIFIKNNLPLVGKVYRVFETIYDKGRSSRLDSMIDGSSEISPRLKEASRHKRREIIYNDLLGVNIESGNPSLRKFLTVLEDGEGLIQKAESEGVDSLSEPERRQFDYFLDKMDTIYSTSLLGRRASKNQPHDPSLHDQTPAERLQQIRTNFRVQEGQTITTRLAEMFVKPLGYESTHQVREAMQQAKASATERNKQFATQMFAEHNGVVQVKAGDIFKGTDQSYLRNILENGSVAKEYLGSDSGSDMTPLDTDVSIILEADIQNGLRDALNVSPSRSYGNITFIARDRGQFNTDSTNGRAYELFYTGAAGERHYGIRTGFASTEIDAILDNGLTDRQRDNIYFTIARNGFYIPVADSDEKIVFTPEMYDEYRKIFDGVSEYDGDPLVVHALPSVDVSQGVIEQTTSSLQALVGTIKEEAVKVDASLEKIRTVVQEVLTTNNVKLRDQYDTGIFGADLADIGSTGRHTNKPGVIMDFDLNLSLDARDIVHMPEIAKELKARLNPREDKSHEETEKEYTQIRAIGAEIDGSEPLDIDIGIGRRADAGIFASHDAINAKLTSIRDRYGEDTYYDVLANIVLAKTILKEGHAYKKLEDGGFGGIGTEDWILANHGNMLEAFKTFYDAAHENGQVVSLDEFRKRYKIFNAGTNIKFPDNAENFVFTLKESGYSAMVNTISEYLQVA